MPHYKKQYPLNRTYIHFKTLFKINQYNIKIMKIINKVLSLTNKNLKIKLMNYLIHLIVQLLINIQIQNLF